MAYLLDTNIFVQAKNREYGFDFCPAFWDWLVAANAQSQVFSIEAVYDELIARDDDVSEWSKAHRALFLAPTEESMRAIAAVQRWANQSPNYDLAAKEEFADVADSQLVAVAMLNDDIIVTHELPSDSRKRIKIPNAAAAHHVKVVNPYVMLRTERARFVLGSAA